MLLDDGRCRLKGTCRAVLVATGEIQVDEFERFQAFAVSWGEGTRAPSTFVIHSPGGNVAGAVKLGMALRHFGLRTVVGTIGEGRLRAGICASACVFVLMGGRTRFVPTDSLLVIHSPKRMASLDRDPAGPPAETGTSRKAVAEILMRYARLMGISPAFITLMMSIPHESGRRLTGAEIRRFRLSTAASRRQ
jgi:hypothetical protein